MEKENYTLLYVEDEDGTRINIAKSLRLRYKEVLEAKDGEEAYRLYKEFKVDLIITDLQMPKMDGVELIKKIRLEDNRTPIVVISAYSDREKLEEVSQMNIVEYAIKPLSRARLKEVLKRGLQNI